MGSAGDGRLRNARARASLCAECVRSQWSAGHERNRRPPEGGADGVTNGPTAAPVCCRPLAARTGERATGGCVCGVRADAQQEISTAAAATIIRAPLGPPVRLDANQSPVYQVEPSLPSYLAWLCSKLATTGGRLLSPSCSSPSNWPPGAGQQLQSGLARHSAKSETGVGGQPTARDDGDTQKNNIKMQKESFAWCRDEREGKRRRGKEEASSREACRMACPDQIWTGPARLAN